MACLAEEINNFMGVYLNGCSLSYGQIYGLFQEQQ